MAPSNNTAVWVLGVSLAAALLVIAFLLGRESLRETAAWGAGQGASSASGVEDGRAGASAEGARERGGDRAVARGAIAASPVDRGSERSTEPDGADRPAERGADRPAERGSDRPADRAPTPAEARAPTPAAHATARAPDPAAASDHAEPTDALRAYFSRLDAIQVGPSGDGEAFAQELLQAALSGDGSRFRQLEADLAGAEQRIAAVRPPPEAEAHHRALLEQVGQARVLLGKVSAGLAQGNPGALEALASEAQRMQSAADALAREDKALRSRL